MSISTHFFSDKPIFGLDIGSSSIKVVQFSALKGKKTIQAYGYTQFDQNAIIDGIVEDYEKLAESINTLFKEKIIGSITTNRAVITVPTHKAYSRLVSLSTELTQKEVADAITLEIEQYIPMPIDELYYDSQIVSRGLTTNDVLISAMPKKIIDSYMNFMRLVNIKPIMVETTISSACRIIAATERSNEIPTVVVDLGSLSTDLTVYDKYLVVNGTVPGGSEDFTLCIADAFGISKAEANNLKIKYGLAYSKKQADIRQALAPRLEQLVKEVRRIIRYHEERGTSEGKIGQIITMGGGANMSGLTEYLTDSLRLPTRMCNFWDSYSMGRIQPPNELERSVYVTAAGAALVDPKKIWSKS